MKKLLFLLIFLFIVQSLFAAPDKVSRKLIDEKVSLMDFGCYQITIALQDLTEQLDDDNFMVSDECRYDTERDEIILQIVIMPKIKKGTRDYEPKDRTLFKDKIEEFEANISVQRPYFANCFLHAGQYVEGGGVNEQDTKNILKKFKNVYLIDTNTKLAETQNGKLVFFDIEHSFIKKK